tara:strand:+ start:663 stop:836 length:174 start_codon:yes stop_codon:yes gene_type:complete
MTREVKIEKLRKIVNAPKPGGMNYGPSVHNNDLFEMLDRIEQKLDALLERKNNDNIN